MRARGWALVVILLGCRGTTGSGGSAGNGGHGPHATFDATPSTAASTGPALVTADAAGASASAAASNAATSAASSSARAARAGDAGPARCRVLRGPVELPVRSQVALALRGDSVDAILNDDGKPRTVAFPVAPVAPPGAPGSPAPALESLDGGAFAGYPVACGVAGDKVFCPDHSGAIHRANRAGGGDRIVASSRTGSRIGVAPFAGSHTALAYLSSRQTSEGWVSEAWLAVDDEAPVRLSEDGSGATSITLGARGSSLLAVSADVRTALTALHVRPVTFEARAKLGEDTVVFVGGPGERRTTPTIAIPETGPAWALLPLAKDV
ncbi:MAG TPA: hypothetical protein VGI39_02375, partial [Polyangiaceae bacterium]